jgi:TPR repeat protein
MKHIKLLIASLLISINSFSQGNLKAKIEYENAEQAFAEEKYEDALTSLLEVENLLQKWTPNVSFLKIQALDKTFNYDDVNDKKTIMLIAEVEKYMNFSEKNEDAIVPDKFKTVYDIEQKVKPLLQIQKWKQMPDYIKGNELYDQKNYLQAIECYKKASSLGNGLADYCIAYIYQDGIPEKDYNNALKWYKMSAQKGCSKAEWQIGLMYESGDGVPVDYNEALKWLKSGAKHGSSESMDLMGYMYGRGEGVNKSYQDAMIWYRKGAEYGNSNCMLNIGYLYQNGNGVEVNNVEAAKWFLKACEKNRSQACVELAALYHNNNNPGIVQNFSEAMKYYLKAGKNAQAYLELGWMYERGQSVNEDKNKAIFYYKKAIDMGNNWALFRLGDVYEDVDFTEKQVGEQTENLAVKYFTLAANKGIKEAMEHLIDIYNYGYKSIKRDRSMEKYWRQQLEAVKNK